MRLETVETGDLLVYQGANNSGGCQHLAKEGDDRTFCGSVKLEYTQEGKVNRCKASDFRSLDSILGDVCTYCRQKLEQKRREGEGL